ncbi:MAG: hypothetical protein ACTSWI_05235 [Alphaproteobacteria bacterium]
MSTQATGAIHSAMARTETTPPAFWQVARRGLAIGAVGFALTLSVAYAFAQDGTTDIPPIPIPHPERIPSIPVTGAVLDAGGEGGPSAIEPEDVLVVATVDADGNPLPPQDFTLVPVLVAGGAPIAGGVNWRVFAEENNTPTTLVADVEGGTTQLQLRPGRYFLHAMFGWAGVTTELLVTPDSREQTVVLDAGGLRLQAAIEDDQLLPTALLRFEVHGEDPIIGDVVIVADARPSDILRLSAGRYYVVSYYGNTNAVVGADIDVEAGLLTELVLYHEAAQVTLKLVSERGAEALANTAWSILTPGGDLLFESIGAFPTVVLAAGDYTAIARHNSLFYEAEFNVETGRNRDIEVLAADPVPTADP